MAHEETGHGLVAQPRELRRHGDVVRVYRRLWQKWVYMIGGTLMLTPTTIGLVEAVTAPSQRGISPHTWLIGGLLVLYAAIPVAYFAWGVRFGVYVSRAGVKNISASSTSFTAWKDIERFVADNYA